MVIPWLPREIASRLYERPHELDNVKAAYLLSNAYVAGFLGREDGKRPAWFNRVRLLPVTVLTPDLQEHLANACRVICMKVRQEVTSEPALRQHTGKASSKPQTTWQGGLLCARVLWRALFAAAAAKGSVPQSAVPILFMCACSSLLQPAQMLLSFLWAEIQVQFTSKVNKYRNVKSRPAWSSLEALQYRVFGEMYGFSLSDPAVTPPTSAGTKPAANLQDFFEEVLALRFTIDWLTLSMQDAQEFIDVATRRIHKRPGPRVRPAADAVSQQLAALKEKSVDSFSMMWTDDAELRGVASLAARLMDGVEGPSALHLAATFVGQMLLATWKGVEPMLAQMATLGISRIAESHAAIGALPPPPMDEADAEASQTSVFDRIASSYAAPSAECKDLTSALPRGVLKSIVKVQSVFRGYLFRARCFARARSVVAYCKAVHWPLLDLPREEEDTDAVKDRKRRKKVQKVDADTLNEQIAEFQPTVSKYLGGESKPSPTKTLAKSTSTAALASTTRSVLLSTEAAQEKRSWPLPTADHRACADLVALYLYNLQRRRELTQMWQTLCGAYERGMDTYAELLKRNPALRPMLESIAAQLKRGAVVGYDKAFIAKQRKAEESAPAKLKQIDEELFKKKAEKPRPGPIPGPGMAGTTGLPLGDSLTGGRETRLPFGAQLSPSASLPPVVSPSVSMRLLSSPTAERKETTGAEVSGDYLTNYMKEMDGDDSQFKDINAAVIPLSTGTSPPRQPPHEFILKVETEKGKVARTGSEGALVPSIEALRARQASSLGVQEEELKGPGEGGSSRGSSRQPTPKRPRLDVPFCLQRVKPIWLPIKAHRFAAYRAKVLQLLPQRVLQQYIDFEKQGQYAACVKLLESATPGSLNVLCPATLVNNKPLLVETVLQLIVGYSGLALKNQQGSVAVRLITQVIDNMSLSLRDLHPGHRVVLEAYLYDTALSVCYYMPTDVSLTDRAESFFQQASDRYLRLGHINRYCKCCLRAAAVLHAQGHRSEAEYYAQQALNKLSDAPVSSLLAVCYHNLAVHTVVQQRVPDAVAHVRSYVALLKQLARLASSFMQLFDNTQWLVLKVQELWPQYQQAAGLVDASAPLPVS